MAVEFKKAWTEADVRALIGQPESIRREFKAGVMFDRDPESKWVEGISKEVSALANTEGGEVILGVDEDKKSKPRVANTIDGVPKALGPERLQQLIEGNVSPYLPGIRVHRVMLLEQSERVVFIIQIPQGSTAYQANDGRYYGRSEFEAKYLPDHEVRLRMNRGKVARATVFLRLGQIKPGAEYEAEVRAKYASALETYRANQANVSPEIIEIIAAQHHPDEIALSLVLRNEGELTLRDPVIDVAGMPSCDSFGNLGINTTTRSTRYEMAGELIYPGDEREIPTSKCVLRSKRGAIPPVGDYIIRWKVFLDNSPPSVGEIDLGAEVKGCGK